MSLRNSRHQLRLLLPTASALQKVRGNFAIDRPLFFCKASCSKYSLSGTQVDKKPLGLGFFFFLIHLKDSEFSESTTSSAVPPNFLGRSLTHF